MQELLREIVNLQHFIQNILIQEVQHAKYLRRSRVTLNNKLTWSDHIQMISKKKANSELGFLQKILIFVQLLYIKSLLYKSMVIGICMYHLDTTL